MAYAYRTGHRPHRSGHSTRWAAAQRLEGPRPGPVGARAEPRVPAGAARAGPAAAAAIGEDDEARALPAVPRRTAARRRSASLELTGAALRHPTAPRGSAASANARRDEARNRPLPRFRTSPRVIVPRSRAVRLAAPRATGRNLPAPPYAQRPCPCSMCGVSTTAPRPLYRALLRNPDHDVGLVRRAPRARRPTRSRPRRSTGSGRAWSAAPGRRRVLRRPPATTLQPLVNAELSDLEGAGRGWTRSGPAWPASRPTTWSGSRAAGRACRSSCSATEESFVAVEDLQRSTRGRGALLPPGRRHRRRLAAVRRAARAPARRRPADARALPGRRGRRPAPAGLRASLGRRRRGGAAAASAAAADRGLRRTRSRSRSQPRPAAASTGDPAAGARPRGLVTRAVRALLGRGAVPLRSTGCRRRSRNERRPRSSTLLMLGLKDESDRPPARRLAAHGPPAGRRPDGRARRDDPLPGGHGGRARAACLSSLTVRHCPTETSCR